MAPRHWHGGSRPERGWGGYTRFRYRQIIVEKAIRANGVDALPYKIWSLSSDYQPRNKFYQKYNTDHFVDLSYEKAIS